MPGTPGRISAAIVAVLAVAVVPSVSAQTAEPARAAWVNGVGDCPPAMQVQAIVAEALPEDELAFATTSSLAVTIADHGDTFEVTIGDQHRVFKEEKRVCEERARMAAVYLALSIRQQKEKPPEPVVAPRTVSRAPTPTSPPASSRPPLRIGMLIAADHSSAGGVVPGAGVSVAIELPRNLDLRLALTENWANAETHQNFPVKLRRGHATLDVGWRGEKGRIAFGVEGGAALGWYRAESDIAVPRAEDASTLALGFHAGGRMRVDLGKGFWVEVEAGARFFARPPRLLLAPGLSTSTENLWPLAAIGAGYRF